MIDDDLQIIYIQIKIANINYEMVEKFKKKYVIRYLNNHKRNIFDYLSRLIIFEKLVTNYVSVGEWNNEWDTLHLKTKLRSVSNTYLSKFSYS